MTTRTTLIVLALDRDACPVFPTICADLEETLSQASAGSFQRTRVFDDFYRFTLDRLTVSVGFCDMERPGWPMPGHPDGAVALVIALTTTHQLEQDQDATRSRQKLGQFLVRRIEDELPCLDVRRTERSGDFDEDIYDAVLESLGSGSRAPAKAPVQTWLEHERLLPANSTPRQIGHLEQDPETAISRLILDAEVVPQSEAVQGRSLPRRPQLKAGDQSRKPRLERPASRGTGRAQPSGSVHAERVLALRPHLNDGFGRRTGVAANAVFGAPENLADRLADPDGHASLPDYETRVRANIREALFTPDPPSIPIRLAAQTLNGASMILMPPIGGAMIVYASLGRTNLVQSARALALSGTALGLGQALFKASPFMSII